MFKNVEEINECHRKDLVAQLERAKEGLKYDVSRLKARLKHVNADELDGYDLSLMRSTMESIEDHKTDVRQAQAALQDWDLYLAQVKSLKEKKAPSKLGTISEKQQRGLDALHAVSEFYYQDKPTWQTVQDNVGELVVDLLTDLMLTYGEVDFEECVATARLHADLEQTEPEK